MTEERRYGFTGQQLRLEGDGGTAFAMDFNGASFSWEWKVYMGWNGECVSNLWGKPRTATIWDFKLNKAVGTVNKV